MKILLTAIFLAQIATAALCLPALAADQAATEAVQARPDSKMSFRFKDKPLPEFLQFISSSTGLAFKTAPDLADMRITVFARNWPVPAVMEFLALGKELDLKQDRQDGVYLVKKASKRPAFPPLSQADLEDPVLKRVIEKIRLKEAPLSFFLDIVSAQSGLNFVVAGDAAELKITTFQYRITVSDFFQFLKTRGLEYTRITGTKTFVIRNSGTGAKDFLEAEAAFNREKYELSAAIYKKIFEKDPRSDIADYALLMSAVSYDWQAARDKSTQALKAEEAALLRLVKDYPASIRLGDAYLYLGQIYSGHAGTAIKDIDCKKALGYYELAATNTYRDWLKAQAAVRKAQCYELLGDKQQAAAAYKEAADKYPGEDIVKSIRPVSEAQRTLFSAGVELQKSGDCELAIRVYEAAIKKDPASALAKEATDKTTACKNRVP